MTDKLIGVMICAYDRDVDYVGELSKSLAEQGYCTAIAYDTNKVLPDAETINGCDFFCSGGGHLERSGGHRRNMQRGIQFLHNEGCRYTLSLTGDAKIAKPQGIADLIDILGDDDLVSPQWHKAVSTMMFFGKTPSLFEALTKLPAGRPQNEKKFKNVLDKLDMKYSIHPMSADDKGIWESIGYSRRHKNYPPG